MRIYVLYNLRMYYLADVTVIFLNSSTPADRRGGDPYELRCAHLTAV